MPLQTSRQSYGITITPLQANIGAEISNVDLRQPLTASLRDAIWSALLEHKVVFFRDQDISRAQHVAFAQNFGEILIPPHAAASNDPVGRVYYGPNHPPLATNKWHSDWIEHECPSMGSVLRAISVPSLGGDTLFSNMIAAYEGLPDHIKERIDGLTAIHSSQKHAYKESGKNADNSDGLYIFEHPVVRTHPNTGEKILYVNDMATVEIKELPPEESKELVAYLCAQASVPEYQVRFTWRNNSIAFWDNRCTQHYAVADYWPAERLLESVSIAGDRPY